MRVGVGASAVLKPPPCRVVKLVGATVGGEIPRVGVGEGIGVAFSNALTVAWTRAPMVASMSVSSAALLAVWVSETTACTVASKTGGNGVCESSALPQAKANSIEKTNNAPNNFIPVIPISAPVFPVQTGRSCSA
jgi:hypothetical protein